eukprot:CAMPEP_0174709482 /NCGR_PEP_ID=MMETSP1094-20130205/11419_1 /TAXON_ID=156173 /ORGANISM="Chrysochromulina brevifilum, Strain UTEX LB 985" /LENGTH=121 /DNA_ID=CAMNT_0015908165 /DNA_START=27 /DNA_END=393 /DNA_ORIENTATION=+
MAERLPSGSSHQMEAANRTAVEAAHRHRLCVNRRREQQAAGQCTAWRATSSLPLRPPVFDPYAICVDPCVNQPRSMRAVTSARRAMGAVAMGASPPPRCSRSAAASVRLPPAVNQALQLGQ